MNTDHDQSSPLSFGEPKYLKDFPDSPVINEGPRGIKCIPKSQSVFGLLMEDGCLSFFKSNRNRLNATMRAAKDTNSPYDWLEFSPNGQNFLVTSIEEKETAIFNSKTKKLLRVFRSKDFRLNRAKWVDNKTIIESHSFPERIHLVPIDSISQRKIFNLESVTEGMPECFDFDFFKEEKHPKDHDNLKLQEFLDIPGLKNDSKDVNLKEMSSEELSSLLRESRSGRKIVVSVYIVTAKDLVHKLRIKSDLETSQGTLKTTQEKSQSEVVVVWSKKMGNDMSSFVEVSRNGKILMIGGRYSSELALVSSENGRTLRKLVGIEDFMGCWWLPGDEEALIFLIEHVALLTKDGKVTEKTECIPFLEDESIFEDAVSGFGVSWDQGKSRTALVGLTSGRIAQIPIVYHK